MTSLFFRSLASLGRKWKPLSFTKGDFVQIPLMQKVEEETIPGYSTSWYYPAHIGEIIKDRYQIVGKLGFGASSTVWLARDMSGRRHVALKLFVNSTTMGESADNELNIYKRIEQSSKSHPGHDAVRPLLDSFSVEGPSGNHHCLVHTPLWESLLDFLHRNPVLRLPAPVLALTLQRVFQALDFLHNECHVIHTDIKATNIMFGIADESVFQSFEEEEISDPCPRKVKEDGMIIYTSRQLRVPKEWTAPVLCDFGSAVLGEIEHLEDIQPDIYRAPEVILKAPWTYSVDTWNVACMIWDLFEGGHLFTGHDPETHTYRSAAHLAEITALLGPPPADLIAQARAEDKLLSNDNLKPTMLSLPQVFLEQRETNLEGQDKTKFLQLMRKMLKWDPVKRSSMEELLQDEWIRKELED